MICFGSSSWTELTLQRGHDSGGPCRSEVLDMPCPSVRPCLAATRDGGQEGPRRTTGRAAKVGDFALALDGAGVSVGQEAAQQQWQAIACTRSRAAIGTLAALRLCWRCPADKRLHSGHDEGGCQTVLL